MTGAGLQFLILMTLVGNDEILFYSTMPVRLHFLKK